jgi:hypothetical protein
MSIRDPNRYFSQLPLKPHRDGGVVNYSAWLILRERCEEAEKLLVELAQHDPRVMAHFHYFQPDAHADATTAGVGEDATGG